MQVPETEKEYDPDGPPCTPLPGSILILGGYHWLGMDGQLRTITPEDAEFAEELKGSAAEYREDPQVFVGASLFGERPVNLNGRTLAYWEKAAKRGGHILDELME